MARKIPPPREAPDPQECQEGHKGRQEWGEQTPNDAEQSMDKFLFSKMYIHNLKEGFLLPLQIQNRYCRRRRSAAAAAAAIPTPISASFSGHSGFAGFDSRHAILGVERRGSPAHQDGLVSAAAGIRGGAEDCVAEPETPRQPQS